MRDDGCDCGWPVNRSHTKWIAHDGYQVTDKRVYSDGTIVFELVKTPKHISDFIENLGDGKHNPIIVWKRGHSDRGARVDSGLIPLNAGECSCPLHDLDDWFDKDLGDDFGAGAEDFEFSDEDWTEFCRQCLIPEEEKE